MYSRNLNMPPHAPLPLSTFKPIHSTHDVTSKKCKAGS